MVQTAEAENDTAAANDLIRLRCAHDLHTFAWLFFPHYCRHPFNSFHRDYFRDVRFAERQVRRARSAPRGYAKSTIAALIKPIHDVCYGLEKFIVVCSNTQSQANGKLKDIRTEVLTNRYLADVYGIRFPRKNPGETSFVLMCDKHQTAFQAVGAGAEVRGIRFGEARPSKIICDDVEHSEEVLNEEIRRKYEDWFFEVICKIGDERTNIDFIGTILHKESLLSKLLKNPAYESRSYRAVISWATRGDLWEQWRQLYTNIDDPNRIETSDAFYKEHEKEMLQGVQVLWPEKEPYLALIKEKIEQGDRAFMKEKQGEPVPPDSRVFDHMHWYKETSEGIVIESSGKLIKWHELQGFAFGVIDPATGAKKGKSQGDWTCILTGYKDPAGRLLVHRDWTKREPPTKYIGQIFDEHEHSKFQKFGVEENLYKELLLPNLADERKRREKEKGTIIRLPFYEIMQTRNKVERITAVEPKVSHGWIVFNRALSGEFKAQLENFPMGSHDDCPDALEMLWGLVNNQYKASSVSLNAMSGR